MTGNEKERGARGGCRGEKEREGEREGEERRKEKKKEAVDELSLPPDKYSSLTDDVRTSTPASHRRVQERTDIISGIDSLRGAPSVRPDNDDTPSSLMTHGTRNTYSR